jgi:imidazolonepropionase-like amidohydrolase
MGQFPYLLEENEMILLRNGALFDGVIGELRAPVDVLIEGTRIKEISEKPLAPGDAQVIDLAGRTIMPGLIDAHVHVIAADANLGKLDEMPRAILYYSAKRTLERGLQRGFTSVRDAGGADYGIAQAIDTNMIKGPRLFFSGKALSLPMRPGRRHHERHCRWRTGGADGGARGTQARRHADQDYGVGRRGIAVRPNRQFTIFR